MLIRDVRVIEAGLKAGVMISRDGLLHLGQSATGALVLSALLALRGVETPPGF